MEHKTRGAEHLRLPAGHRRSLSRSPNLLSDVVDQTQLQVPFHCSSGKGEMQRGEQGEGGDWGRRGQGAEERAANGGEGSGTIFHTFSVLQEDAMSSDGNNSVRVQLNEAV
eukprot:768060-Hanusia_phi.AAC.2